RGFVGTFDSQVTTDASSVFTVTPPSALTEGFQCAVAVVVGQPDQPPLPGYSSTSFDAFRIDKNPPQITSASATPGGLPLISGQINLSSLTTLTLNVADWSNPSSGPLGTPAVVRFPAIDPATAANTSNFQLWNTTTNADESQ